MVMWVSCSYNSDSSSVIKIASLFFEHDYWLLAILVVTNGHLVRLGIIATSVDFQRILDRRVSCLSASVSTSLQAPLVLFKA